MLFENLDPIDPSPSPTAPIRGLSPLRFFAGLIVMIFLAEMAAMVILYFLQISNYRVASILDGIIMLALIVPGLYYLQLRPLRKQIEDRTRAVSALRASEQRLRKVLELLPVGVWITNQDGKIVLNNPASRLIWRGERVWDISQHGGYRAWWVSRGKRVSPEEWPGARALTRGETSLNEEIEIECYDGERKIILYSAVPILDDKDSTLGAVIVNQDITRRRREEKALVRANELLERVFFSIDTLIAHLDRDFNFVRVNETYARAGGHPAEFFVGRNHFDLYPHADNEAIFRRVVETCEPYSAYEKPFEYAEYEGRGMTYWNWSLQPVRGVGGAVEGVVLSLVDVTERKLAQIQLERQNQELRNLYLAETSARRAAEILSAASQALTQTLDLEQVIHTLLDYLQGLVPAEVASVILMESEGRMAVRALKGYNGWVDVKEIPALPFDEITDQVIQQIQTGRRSLTLHNNLNYPPLDDLAGPEPIHTWLVTPVIASDNVIGLAALGKAQPGPFTPEENRWVEALIGQAAVAIQNAWLFEQVRASSVRLQSLARKLVEVQENERHTIARELHDEAGQALSSLKLRLGRLEQDPSCPAGFHQRLQDLKEMADCVLENLHRLAMDLRPAALDHLGLVAALDQIASSMNSDQLSVRFKALGFQGERLPREMEASLYRIVQEALTNVVRHAQAGSVGILLERADGGLKVFIEDDGIGFSPVLTGEDGRLGLVGMRERAEMFAGTLTVESSPGLGTSIIVEIPYDNSDPDRG